MRKIWIGDSFVIPFSSAEEKAKYLQSEYKFTQPQLQKFWREVDKEKRKECRKELMAARRKHYEHYIKTIGLEKKGYIVNVS